MSITCVHNSIVVGTLGYVCLDCGKSVKKCTDCDNEWIGLDDTCRVHLSLCHHPNVGGGASGLKCRVCGKTVQKCPECRQEWIEVGGKCCS
jgi:hypothetical protein